MLTLHHLEYSQSFRILWLLEELDVNYQFKLYQRDPVTILAPDEYKKMSPLGTAPFITDGDLTLAETNAIVDYLMDQHPQSNLVPAVSDPDRSRHLFWYNASQASLMPMMLMNAVMRISLQRSPFFVKPILKSVNGKIVSGMIKPRVNKLLQMAEEDLSKKEWFGGQHFSTADIAMSYPLESAKSRGFIDEKYPACLQWFERAYAREAFKRAKEKDGKASMVLPV